MSDLHETTRPMRPMLADSIALSAAAPYLVNEDWFAQQKLDGDRILIRVDANGVRALNREGEPRRNPMPRKILDQFRGLPGTWHLDGELLDGVLWLFDLPQAIDTVNAQTPFAFRLDVLERFFPAWAPDACVRLLPTARTAADKKLLLAKVRAAGGEGIVLKHSDAPYSSGKRSARMLKVKFTHTVDAVVTAVGRDGKLNCHVSVFDNGHPIELVSVALQGKPPVVRGDVIEIEYLYATHDERGRPHLVQARMSKIRTDKSPSSCTIDQLSYTDRSVVKFRSASTALIRQQRRNHETGTLVTVYDLDADGAPLVRSEFDGRWLTVCEDHGFNLTHETLKVARNHAASPSGWCAACHPTDQTLEI